MNRSSGFTLLEVLVAVTLLSIAVAAVYANFSIGLNSYRKGIKRGELVREGLGGLRMLQSDLECMVSGGEASFAKEHLSFPVTAGTDGSSFRLVTYALDGTEIVRSSGPVGDRKGAASAVPVMRGIISAEFEYFDGEAWVTDLKKPGKDKVPVSVRIRLGMTTDGEDGFFQTTFLFPAKKSEDEKKGGS